MAALQASGKCSHTQCMLRFTDLSRHSPTLPSKGGGGSACALPLNLIRDFETTS